MEPCSSRSHEGGLSTRPRALDGSILQDKVVPQEVKTRTVARSGSVISGLSGKISSTSTNKPIMMSRSFPRSSLNGHALSAKSNAYDDTTAVKRQMLDQKHGTEDITKTAHHTPIRPQHRSTTQPISPIWPVIASAVDKLPTRTQINFMRSPPPRRSLASTGPKRAHDGRPTSESDRPVKRALCVCDTVPFTSSVGPGATVRPAPRQKVNLKPGRSFVYPVSATSGNLFAAAGSGTQKVYGTAQRSLAPPVSTSTSLLSFSPSKFGLTVPKEFTFSASPSSAHPLGHPGPLVATNKDRSIVPLRALPSYVSRSDERIPRPLPNSKLGNLRRASTNAAENAQLAEIVFSREDMPKASLAPMAGLEESHKNGQTIGTWTESPLHRHDLMRLTIERDVAHDLDEVEELAVQSPSNSAGGLLPTAVQTWSYQRTRPLPSSSKIDHSTCHPASQDHSELLHSKDTITTKPIDWVQSPSKPLMMSGLVSSVDTTAEHLHVQQSKSRDTAPAEDWEDQVVPHSMGTIARTAQLSPAMSNSPCKRPRSPSEHQSVTAPARFVKARKEMVTRSSSIGSLGHFGRNRPVAPVSSSMIVSNQRNRPSPALESRRASQRKVSSDTMLPRSTAQHHDSRSLPESEDHGKMAKAHRSSRPADLRSISAPVSHSKTAELSSPSVQEGSVVTCLEVTPCLSFSASQTSLAGGVGSGSTDDSMEMREMDTSIMSSSGQASLANLQTLLSRMSIPRSRRSSIGLVPTLSSRKSTQNLLDERAVMEQEILADTLKEPERHAISRRIPSYAAPTSSSSARYALSYNEQIMQPDSASSMQVIGVGDTGANAGRPGAYTSLNRRRSMVDANARRGSLLSLASASNAAEKTLGTSSTLSSLPSACSWKTKSDTGNIDSQRLDDQYKLEGNMVFKDVIAFVDVKTAEGDEAGGVFVKILRSLGARVSLRLRGFAYA